MPVGPKRPYPALGHAFIKMEQGCYPAPVGPFVVLNLPSTT